MYRIRKYRDTNGRVPFEDWMNTIVDRTTKVRLLKRLDKVQLGNLGDDIIKAKRYWQEYKHARD